MFAWILLIISSIALVLIFLRRLRLTTQDLRFQNNLAQQEAQEKALEEATEAAMEEQLQDIVAPKKSNKSAGKLFSKADMHFGRKEWAEAEDLFLEVIEVDSTHLDAHHKLGMLYMKVDDFQNAELYFSKLVNLKKDPIYFSNLGAALYQQQRLVEAAEAYENALALDDKRAARLQSLAQVYYELGNDEKALHYFERAAKRKPKDLTLKLILADYYQRLGRTEEAIALFEQVLEADPYNEAIKAQLKTLKG